MFALLQSEGSLTGALLSTLLALVVLACAAYALLRWLSSRGLGAGRPGKHLRVVERVPLDFKNALYVVQSGDRSWLVATGERGAPRLLTELDAAGDAQRPPAKPDSEA